MTWRARAALARLLTAAVPPVTVLATAVTGLVVQPAPAALAAAPAQSLCPGADTALFGPNVCFFSTNMSQRAIQANLNAIADQQVPDQFGAQRYAVFFEPGTYGSAADPLVFQVGYYTEVAGLGAIPDSTVINGVADVFNQCFGAPNSKRRRHELRGVGQLLAFPVQPDAQPDDGEDNTGLLASGTRYPRLQHAQWRRGLQPRL